MKYAIRKSVFETNSSSTHSVQIIKAGSDIKTSGPTTVTLLKDSADKYVFLIGILDELSHEYQLVEDIYDDESKSKQDLEFKLIKNYLDEYYKTHFNKTDEDIKALIAIHQRNGEPLCRSFFEEACLDECTCSLCFSSKFYQVIGYDTLTQTFNATHLDSIFAENCEIACGEHYAGCGKMSCLEGLFK